MKNYEIIVRDNIFNSVGNTIRHKSYNKVGRNVFDNILDTVETTIWNNVGINVMNKSWRIFGKNVFTYGRSNVWHTHSFNVWMVVCSNGVKLCSFNSLQQYKDNL